MSENSSVVTSVVGAYVVAESIRFIPQPHHLSLRGNAYLKEQTLLWRSEAQIKRLTNLMF